MQTPFISVLLAVHNGENYMRHAINSVLQQTYKNFELLIGPNGTHSDRTEEIAKEYKEKDARVKICLASEKGKSHMLNYMLKHAKGDYIAIQDHDDLWHDTKLQKQADYLKKFPDTDVLGTWFDCIDAHDEILFVQETETKHEDIVRECRRGINEVGNFTSLVRTSKLREAGGWDPKWEGIEDFDLWLRLINQGLRFANVAEILGKHRLHKKSSFNTQDFTEKLKQLVNEHTEKKSEIASK